MNLSNGNNGTGTITLCCGSSSATLQFIGVDDGTSRGINMLDDATLDASGTSPTSRRRDFLYQRQYYRQRPQPDPHRHEQLQGGEIGGHVNLGSGSLTKTGPGVWDLDVSSTMGGLTVNGGNLILVGSNTISGPAVVESGMLTVTTAGGIGNQPLTIDAGGTFIFDPQFVANNDSLSAGLEGGSPPRSRAAFRRFRNRAHWGCCWLRPLGVRSATAFVARSEEVRT